MKLRKLGIPILLTIVIAMSFMGRTFAYYQRKTSWSIYDDGSYKGGLKQVVVYADTSSNGYMQLYVYSAALSWGYVWGYVEWEFTPTSTLYNVIVQSNMEADFYLMTFGATAQVWFTLEVVNTGKMDEEHWWWTDFRNQPEYRKELLSINFGTMLQDHTYTIRSTIKLQTNNRAWLDADTDHASPPPTYDYDGYANVIDQVVYTSGC